MELFEEILLHHLKKNQGAQGFPADPQALVHDTAYHALNAIRIILARDDLEDPECFRRIEKIVRVYERIGSGCGTRHDFG